MVSYIIPPSDSPYADPTVFDMIENTIVELTSENENTQVCLLRDFNARIVHLSDRIHPAHNDDDVNNSVNICEDNV